MILVQLSLTGWEQPCIGAVMMLGRISIWSVEPVSRWLRRKLWLIMRTGSQCHSSGYLQKRVQLHSKRQKEVPIEYPGRTSSSHPFHHPGTLATAGQHTSYRSADTSGSRGGVVGAQLLAAFSGHGAP